MKKLIGILISGLLITTGCSKQENAVTRNTTPVVYTVNYPLAYFAERIAGGQIEIKFPKMEGDPAFWNPAAEQIAAYQKADLILLNGAGYAKWVQQVSLPPAKLIDTSKAFKDQYIAIGGATSHSHGAGEKHVHGKIAFTTWLDPQQAIQQAAAIRDVFSVQWQEHAPEFETNFQAFKKELHELDAQFKSSFSALSNEPLIGSHPVYQYLTRRYGLNMKSVHWEPDQLPDQSMERELDDILEAHPAKIMLWEGTPLPTIEQLVEKKGLQARVFDPCGNRPDQGDYLTVMKENLKNVNLR